MLLVLSFNLFNELVKPFSLKRAAKIRTFFKPPNFFALFFDFFHIFIFTTVQNHLENNNIQTISEKIKILSIKELSLNKADIFARLMQDKGKMCLLYVKYTLNLPDIHKEP